MWSQNYDPLHSALLSTLVAAIPVVVLLGAIAFSQSERSPGGARWDAERFAGCNLRLRHADLHGGDAPLFSVLRTDCCRSGGSF